MKDFRKIRVKLLVFLLCTLSVVSCSNNTLKVKGNITQVTFSHIIDLREGCLFSRIYFDLEWVNNSDSSDTLRLTKYPGHCNFELDTSSLYWVHKNESMPITIVEGPESIVINPHDTVTIRLVGIYRLMGRSLNDIFHGFKPWLEDGYFVFNGDSDLIGMRENTDVIFLLDKEIVTPSDSLFYKERKLPAMDSFGNVSN